MKKSTRRRLLRSAGMAPFGARMNPGLRDYLSAGRGAAREVGSSLAQAPSELVGEAQRGLGKLQAGLKEFGSRARAAAEREEAKRKCDEPTPEQALKVLARALGVKSNPGRRNSGSWAVGDEVIWHQEKPESGTYRERSAVIVAELAPFHGTRVFKVRVGKRTAEVLEDELRPVSVRSNFGYRRNLGDGPPPPPPVGNPSYLFTMPSGGVSARPTRRNLGEGSFPAPFTRLPRGHYRSNPASTRETSPPFIDVTVAEGRVRAYDPRDKNKWYNIYVTDGSGTEARYALHTGHGRNATPYWGSNETPPSWVLRVLRQNNFDWREA